MVDCFLVGGSLGGLREYSLVAFLGCFVHSSVSLRLVRSIRLWSTSW